jgi:type II secretory pathway pseudopilin PulG
LIEVTVAAFLVAVAVLALAAIIPMSMRSSRRSGTRVVAHNLARQYLEWWRQQGFTTLKAAIGSQRTYDDPLQGPVPAPPSPQQYGSLASADSEAVYHTTVSFQAGPDPNLVEVDIKVDWTTGSGTVPSEVHYATQVYNASNPF